MQESMAEPYDNPGVWVPRLQRILMEQASCYASLDTLSRQQSERIHDDDTDALLSVLARRQEIIDRLSALATEFAPFRERWSILMGQIDETLSSSFNESLSSLARVMDAIATRDEHDRLVLEQRRNVLSQDMQQVRSAHGAVNAYRSNSQQVHVPRYQDRSV
ncbi:MAG: flagellar export chaperone FlgN [Phycisphaerales bacterium JB043]